MPVVSKAPNKKEVKQEKQKLPLMQRLVLKIMQKRLKKAVQKTVDRRCSDIYMLDKQKVYAYVDEVNDIDGFIDIYLCDTKTKSSTDTKRRISINKVCRIEYYYGQTEYFSCTIKDDDRPKITERGCSRVYTTKGDYYMSVERNSGGFIRGSKCTQFGEITTEQKTIARDEVCGIKYYYGEYDDDFPCEKSGEDGRKKLDSLAFLALLFAFLLPPLGFFLSIFSISKINHSNRRVRGKGIAVFALIVSLLIMGAIGVIYGLGLY